MGFGDFIGSVIGRAVNVVKDAEKRTQVYNAEMTSKSNSELARIIKSEGSASPLRSGAALQELKSRGFSQEDIKELVRNS